MFQMKESKLVPSLCHGNLTLLIKLFHTKFHYFTAQQRCTTVSLETNFRFMIFFYFSEPHVTAQTTCSRNLLGAEREQSKWAHSVQYGYRLFCQYELQLDHQVKCKIRTRVCRTI